MQKKNSSPSPLRMAGSPKISAIAAALVGGQLSYDLLAAEENPGKNHPEGEQSGKGSSGGDGYHCLGSSEIVVSLVSPTVVTRPFHGCKQFVTGNLHFPRPSHRPMCLDPALRLSLLWPLSTSAVPKRKLYARSAVDGVESGAPFSPALSAWLWCRTYLRRRKTRGRTTQRANSPAKVPAAAMAIIAWVPPKSL